MSTRTIRTLLLVSGAIWYFALGGCCLAPDRVGPELEHMSHITQHQPLTDRPGHDAVNIIDLAAQWDLGKRGYIQISEGVSLNREQGRYPDEHYGEIYGPREQFSARIGFWLYDKER